MIVIIINKIKMYTDIDIIVKQENMIRFLSQEQFQDLIIPIISQVLIKAI